MQPKCPKPVLVHTSTKVQLFSAIQFQDYLRISLVPRGLLPDVLVPYRGLDRAWNTLGLTPTTYSPGNTQMLCDFGAKC